MAFVDVAVQAEEGLVPLDGSADGRAPHRHLVDLTATRDRFQGRVERRRRVQARLVRGAVEVEYGALRVFELRTHRGQALAKLLLALLTRRVPGSPVRPSPAD